MATLMQTLRDMKVHLLMFGSLHFHLAHVDGLSRFVLDSIPEEEKNGRLIPDVPVGRRRSIITWRKGLKGNIFSFFVDNRRVSYRSKNATPYVKVIHKSLLFIIMQKLRINPVAAIDVFARQHVNFFITANKIGIYDNSFLLPALGE